MAVIGETDPTGQMTVMGVLAAFYRTVTITGVPFLGDVKVALEIEEGGIKTYSETSLFSETRVLTLVCCIQRGRRGQDT